MNHVVQEPLKTSIDRGNGEVIFTVVGEIEDRFLDYRSYELDDGTKAYKVSAEGNILTVTFPRALIIGDALWC